MPRSTVARWSSWKIEMEGGENTDAEAERKGVLAAVAACGSGLSDALWLKRFGVKHFDIFRGMEGL